MRWSENFRNRISTSHPQVHGRDLSSCMACYDGCIGARIPTRPIRCFVRALPSERIDCVFLSSDRRSPLGSSANWEEVECLVGQHRQPYGCRWDRRADRSGGRRFQNENVEALVGRPGRCRNAWEAAYPFCRNDLDALVRLNEASTRTWPKPCAC